MTDIEIQKLRESGISEATIQEFIAESKTKSDKGPVQPQPSVQSTLPEIDPNTPSETFIAAKQSGTPTMGVGPSATQTATEVGMAVAPYAGGAALGAAGLYGAGLARQGFKALREQALAKQASEAGIQRRFEERMAQQAGGAKPAPTTTLLDSRGRPIAPTAPTAAPVAPPSAVPQAPVAQPTMLQRGMDMASKIRNLAANRALSIGGGAMFALQPSDLGPKVPQSGPFRGMEINPQTGRPFTEQELAMYR